MQTSSSSSSDPDTLEFLARLLEKHFDSFHGVAFEEAAPGMPTVYYINHAEHPFGMPLNEVGVVDGVYAELGTGVIVGPHPTEKDLLLMNVGGSEPVWITGKGHEVCWPTGGPIYSVKLNVVAKPRTIIAEKVNENERENH